MSVENIIKPSELDHIQPYTNQLKEHISDKKDMPLDIVAKNFAESNGLKVDVVKKYCKLLLIASNQKNNVIMPDYQEPQLGDIVEVEILEVRSYGFLVTTFAHGYRGLVHISEIAEEFIAFPEDYARIGDKHLAKIILIDEKGFSLSFKAIGGLKPIYQSNEKLKSLPKSEKFNEITSKSPIPQLQGEGLKLISLVSKALGGTLSVRAEHEFLRLIRDYGIVDVTLKLQEVLRDLDYGVLIGKIVEKKISRIDSDYIASSHSIDAYMGRVAPDISRVEADQAIVYMCNDGQILFDNGMIRIIQYGDLAFPCVSDLNGWIIKTTLFYKMIANKTIDQLTKECY